MPVVIVTVFNTLIITNITNVMSIDSTLMTTLCITVIIADTIAAVVTTVAR